MEDFKLIIILSYGSEAAGDYCEQAVVSATARPLDRLVVVLSS